MRERTGYIGLDVRPKYRSERNRLIGRLAEFGQLQPARSDSHITTHFVRNIQDDEVGCLRSGLSEGLRILSEGDFRVGGFGYRSEGKRGVLFLKVAPPDNFEEFDALVKRSLPTGPSRIQRTTPLHVSMGYFRNEQQDLVLRLCEGLIMVLFDRISWEFRVNQAAICLGKQTNFVKAKSN